MEAEYIACSTAILEAVWIKGFLKSLNIKEILDEPIKVIYDNQAVILMDIKAPRRRISFKYQLGQL